MKANVKLFNRLIVVCSCIAFIGYAAPAAAEIQHPELSEQEMYVPCSQCHKESSPEIYTQWYESSHGIAMVKCYQCHGTFETFKVIPSREDCAVCHEKMMNKCSQDKDCWQCHIAHVFPVKP